jgi:hypothetical protein
MNVLLSISLAEYKNPKCPFRKSSEGIHRLWRISFQIRVNSYQSHFQRATNIKKNDYNGKFHWSNYIPPIIEDVEMGNTKLMQLMFNFEIRSNNYYNVEV